MRFRNRASGDRSQGALEAQLLLPANEQASREPVSGAVRSRPCSRCTEFQAFSGEIAQYLCTEFQAFSGEIAPILFCFTGEEAEILKEVGPGQGSLSNFQ